ncbi:hypothetical protein FW774_12380 [Pedobacter sp. BS3]|uniref:hypothetical protein n=1 Tax=Pedobacter sp. BS3 TaxID=2567937 RepID=UPI0011ED30A4|nr:hypothetical protein [Pedobacter sp. BS3]TZF83094.1 hypothetical protein FW774_12380 [Pedobacter sp. BS3]
MKKLPVLLIAAYAMVLAGCSLFGLDVQKDAKHPKADTIDAHLYKNAWEYIKSRSIESATDTLFKPFYTGIIYSGIDTNEYKKENRTYILLNSEAVYKKNSALSFFNNVPGKTGLTGKNDWRNYDKDVVKAYLQYLIIEGQYAHENIPITRLDVKTTCPAGTYPSNPNSIMNLRVYNGEYPGANQQDSPIIINENLAAPTNFVITSDLRPTNGIIQVVRCWVDPNAPVIE